MSITLQYFDWITFSCTNNGKKHIGKQQTDTCFYWAALFKDKFFVKYKNVCQKT